MKISLPALIKHISSYPIEDFGYDKKPDNFPLFGANDWKLTVGHIRAAKKFQIFFEEEK